MLFLDKISVKTSTDKDAGSKADIQFVIVKSVNCVSGGSCDSGEYILPPILRVKNGFQEGGKVTFSNLGDRQDAQFDFMDQHIAARMLNVDDNWKGDVDFEFKDLNGDDFILSCKLTRFGEIKLNQWTVTAKNFCTFQSKSQFFKTDFNCFGI